MAILIFPKVSFKIFEVSLEKSGFPRFSPTLPDFSRFFYLKRSGKLRKTQDRVSRHDPNFGTGRVALPDPDPHLSKSRDGHPDLNLDLDPTRPDFCRDIFPLEISRPLLMI